MISLSSSDVSFMLVVLQLSPELQYLLESISNVGGEISEDEADSLRDCCTERFDIYGLDDNYNLTEEGQYLEKLIDKLYVG